MNDATHEQLSALMDGELPRDELRFLLRRVEHDAALSERWSRYQVMRAVFRHEPLPIRGDAAFAAAVMARLERADEAEAAVQPRRGMRLLRLAGGGAIAASVAVLALLATRPTGDQSGSAPALAAVAVAPVPASVPAAASRFAPAPKPVFPDSVADFTQPASFDSPLVPSYTPRYPGQQAGAGAEGFVPYVLLIGARQAADAQAEAAEQRKQ